MQRDDGVHPVTEVTCRALSAGLLVAAVAACSSAPARQSRALLLDPSNAEMVEARAARLGFYDDARFHRVVEGYIAPFGLSGDPAVTAAWRGHELSDDPPRSDNARYVRVRADTFACAQNSPDTRLAQVHAGYGDESGSGMRQGRQGPIERGGNAYLDREYPLLDRIIRACVITPVRSC